MMMSESKTPNSPHWTEDAAHENGTYSCVCEDCGQLFVGHKRRHQCKLCYDLATARAEVERLRKVVLSAATVPRDLGSAMGAVLADRAASHGGGGIRGGSPRALLQSSDTPPDIMLGLTAVSTQPRYAGWVFVKHADGDNWTTGAKLTPETWAMIAPLVAAHAKEPTNG